MEITEVRVKLVEDSSDRLQAFCTITFDGEFVVRDLKIIEGGTGHFVAMPSRKVSVRCNGCGHKSESRANYCCHCGKRMSGGNNERSNGERTRQFADIAHPINADCRSRIERVVLEAFEQEMQKRREDPNYEGSYDDS